MSYNLVLDEPVELDLVEEHSGLNFVVDKMLYETTQGFTIKSDKQDNITYYTIVPNVKSEVAGGCASCSSCG